MSLSCLAQLISVLWYQDFLMLEGYMVLPGARQAWALSVGLLAVAVGCRDRTFNAGSATTQSVPESAVAMRMVEPAGFSTDLFHWTSDPLAATDPKAYLSKVLGGSALLEKAKAVRALDELPYGSPVGPGLLATGNAVASSHQGKILLVFRARLTAPVPFVQTNEIGFEDPSALAVIHSQAPAIYHVWTASSSSSAGWALNLRSLDAIALDSVRVLDLREGKRLAAESFSASDLQADYATVVRKFVPWLPLVRSLGWGQFLDDEGHPLDSAVLEAIVTELAATPREVRDGFARLPAEVPQIFDYADPTQEPVVAFAANLGKAVKFGYSSEYSSVLEAVKLMGFLRGNPQDPRSLQRELIAEWKENQGNMRNLQTLAQLAEEIVETLEKPSLDDALAVPYRDAALRGGATMACIDACTIHAEPAGTLLAQVRQGTLVAVAEDPGAPTSWVHVVVPDDGPAAVRGKKGWVRAQSLVPAVAEPVD